MNHYDWLNENLNAFWLKVLGKSLDETHCAGIVTAHGDKCYGYKNEWEDAGIPFHHGVAIYLLARTRPYSEEVRDTPNGWVDPGEWVISVYPKFKEHLNT